jgi:hypothetical protein
MSCCPLPAARHVVEQHANNPFEADHDRLVPLAANARLEMAPIGPSDQRRTRLRAEPRCGHYELGLDVDPRHQLSAAFTAELMLAT